MNFFLSFIFCGIVCAISQIVLEKTKLTPGHINTFLVIIGCVLGGFGIYDILLNVFGSGASTPIINFGYLMVKGASEGYIENGLLGLLKGVFTYSSAGVCYTIFISFIVSMLFKVKN